MDINVKLDEIIGWGIFCINTLQTGTIKQIGTSKVNALGIVKILWSVVLVLNARIVCLLCITMYSKTIIFLVSSRVCH